MARRKFKSEATAKSFSKRVSGKVVDVRNDDMCDANFTVKYEQTKSTRKHYFGNDNYINTVAKKQIAGDFSDFD